MKAVIMAGGEGSRLRPLTSKLPKPMTRLLGRPVMEYIFELLAQNGITEATVTLRYLPQSIKDHFGKSFAGISVNYTVEDEPMGTAGSVALAAEGYDDDIIVISGDAMCDFDLSAAVRYHKQTGASATMIVKKVDDPREYGLVMSKNGLITGFIEKPCYSQAVSDLANTGIYVISKDSLELIPKGEQFDFAKDLFPEMLRRRMKIAAYEADGYWCDVGDIGSYVSCQLDMLSGKVRFKSPTVTNGIVALSQIPDDCIVCAPAYIGANVLLGRGCKISDSVIGDSSSIGINATVKNSVVDRDVTVSAGSKLRGAVVCSGTSIGREACVYEGAVVGEQCDVGDRAVVFQNVKLWPHKRIEPDREVRENVKESRPMSISFGDHGIEGVNFCEITPERVALIGAAVGSAAGSRSVGVCCDCDRAAVLKSALAAGIASTGSDVADLGVAHMPKFRYLTGICALPLSVYISTQNRFSIEIFDENGLPVTRPVERKIEGYLARGEFSRKELDGFGRIREISDGGVIYINAVANSLADLGNIGVRVTSPNTLVKDDLESALFCCGAKNGDDISVELDADGELTALSIFGEREEKDRLFALCCNVIMKSGRDIAVSYVAPDGIDVMASGLGRRVLRYLQCPADSRDENARKLAAELPALTDGIMRAALIIGFVIKNATSLSAAMEDVPNFFISTLTVECEKSPGSVLSEFHDDDELGEGAVIRKDGTRVIIKPLRSGRLLKIYAEANSFEAAQELAADTQSLIRHNLLDRNDRSV